MRRLHTLTALLMGGLLLSTLAADTAKAVTLVRDGEPTSVIVTANEPGSVQQLAAVELQYHLEKMTGAKVPIVSEGDLRDTGATRIYVGQSEALNALGIDTRSLEPETLIVRTVDGALVLAGEDTDGEASLYDEGLDPDLPSEAAAARAAAMSGPVHSGTLYAVYDFLQDELACRWLWPGPTGEVIPKRRTVEVGALDVQQTPKMFMRHFRPGVRSRTRSRAWTHFPRYMEGKLDAMFEPMARDEQLWFRRMKMGMSDKPQYGHAFTEWYDRYYGQHPEIFALQPDGHRGIANETYPKEFVKMCVSSDKLVDMLIEQFQRQREENPNHRWLNAVENDGSLGFCVCEDCKALDVKLNDEVRATLKARGWSEEQIESQFAPNRHGIPNSLTNRYFHFYNTLARRLAEVAPDAYVVTYAYSKYRFAPLDLDVEPNIMIGLIGFSTYPMADETREQEVSNVQAWKRRGATKMFFRPNTFFFSQAHGFPWDATHSMAGDLKMLIDSGMVATDYNSHTGHSSTAGLSYYVMARLHWDHQAEVAELRDEFVQAFGPAAEPIDQYFRHWEQVFQEAYARPDFEQIVERADPLGGRLGRRMALPLFVTEQDLVRGRDLLAQARAAVEEQGDQDLLQTIHVLELGLRHGELILAGARFAIERKYDQPQRYEKHWPTVVKIHELRERLGELRAHNIFWLDAFSLRMHDMYETRVYYDFYNRLHVPVMTPARKDWKFIPDPTDIGESEGWFRRSLPESMAVQASEHPAYRHLFYSTWDTYPPVTGWKRSSGHDVVINGWYQIDWTLSEEDLTPGNVLYVPYIKGSAKIWINDQLVREISAERGAAEEAITITPEEVGIAAGEPFRLTIRVQSPKEPGGLIGPVYVAEPSEG